MKKQIIAALIAILGASVTEAGTGTGLVKYFVHFDLNGQETFVVRFSSMNSIAGCATANRFTMSASNPTYKTTKAIILGAWLAGNTTVFVHGNGTCNTYGASEDLAYICAGGDPC